MRQTLLQQLVEEKATKRQDSLYCLTQIKFSYNSNKIEGSRLSEDQTRYIYETDGIDAAAGKAANTEDIIEAMNHFACFDYMLDHASEELSEDMIKSFHYILRRGTSDKRLNGFRVGEYKSLPNMIDDTLTVSPSKVSEEVKKLLEKYRKTDNVTIEDIAYYHYRFECIHPFQDGNGRTGRVIMFKECLKNNIMPFIIENQYKHTYSKGIKEYEREKGYLVDILRTEQDGYRAEVEYFNRK